ncbi:MAG: minor capsid protein [Ruminococcus sp.]|nr:minor capsid protein [Ruminococcus sp.]
MNNADYWKQRFTQLEAAQNKIGIDAYADIEKQYRQAIKDIESKIALWYQRLADNNGVSMAEARKLLSASELKEFKWDVTDYIKYGKENAVNGQWIKELENASAKYHISKFEALKIKIRQSLEALFAKQHETVTKTMSNVFKSGYYHTAYELQKGFNIGWDIASLNQNQIKKVLSKPWAVDGKNFSERIWGNKEKLINEVHSELSRNIITGADPQKVIDVIAKKMNTSKSNAGRLVMTEEAYFSSAAQKDCFNDLDVEQYEIVATLDSHTSNICRSLDGKVLPMKDYQAGVTAPPFHVRCRSVAAPHFDDDFGVIGERAAKNADGKKYYVPDDMTYEQWYERFVDNSEELGIIEAEDGLYRNTSNIGVFSSLPERMTKKHIRNIARLCGIDMKGIRIHIDNNSELLNLPLTGRADSEEIGGITFFPNAFVSRRELVSTLIHEKEHVKQFKDFGVEYVQNNRNYFERLAYLVEEREITRLEMEGLI